MHSNVYKQTNTIEYEHDDYGDGMNERKTHTSYIMETLTSVTGHNIESLKLENI